VFLNLDFDRPYRALKKGPAQSRAEGALQDRRNSRQPVELSVTVFEGDDVGVTEAARHGADDFGCQSQVAGMLRASLLKPRLSSRSASDWMSRIVIVFASAMTDASSSVVVRAAAGVSRTDGGPPRGARGGHGIASSPSEVEFDGSEIRQCHPH